MTMAKLNREFPRHQICLLTAFHDHLLQEDNTVHNKFDVHMPARVSVHAAVSLLQYEIILCMHAWR